MICATSAAPKPTTWFVGVSKILFDEVFAAGGTLFKTLLLSEVLDTIYIVISYP
jgi:hypothetical protein